MTEIILRRLTLLNFKGIRSLTIDFDQNETNIYGANATGKTTVFDAFRWVLFGKDSTDRKEFNIKTLDSDGKVIERLPHEVTAYIEVNGEEIVLKKCFVEKWTKKRGSAVETFTGNGIECYYNDVPCTATEYDRKISDICNEQVFRLITNPLYFTSQKKDFQRGMLISLAGEISIEDIVGDNADFAELVSHLSGKTLEEFKREIASKKRKVKEDIDTIPARIDERRRDMPQAQNWYLLEQIITEAEASIKELDAQMADRTKAYREANKGREEVARTLSRLTSDITAREYELRDKLLADHRNAVRAHENAVSRAEQLRNERRLKNITLPRLEDELTALQKKRNVLLDEWRKLKARVFEEPSRDMFVCPTCKRPLEADDIDAQIAEMRNAFNQELSRLLESNKKRGIETKAAIDAKTAEIAAIKDAIFKIDSEIAAVENSTAYMAVGEEPDVKPAVDADATLREWRKQADELRASLAEEVSVPDTADLQAKRQEEVECIGEAKARLRDREIIEANNKRIAELENEYKARQDEIARLEGTEFTIQQFAKARIELVESRINGMFSHVRFKMYEQQINGGEIETCEATVDGVPFSDLNSAKKINAGLDIINAICRAHGIVAPIFIDNRESVSEIVSTQSQIVNLIVDGDCKKLRVL